MHFFHSYRDTELRIEGEFQKGAREMFRCAGTLAICLKCSQPFIKTAFAPAGYVELDIDIFPTGVARPAAAAGAAAAGARDNSSVDDDFLIKNTGLAAAVGRLGNVGQRRHV